MKNIVIAAVLLAVVPQVQAQFNASDLIYVPIVAHNEGVNDSVWRSDLYITNVDVEPIDIAMVFVPSGIYSNGGALLDRTQWMGGRVEEEFGIINEDLADIPVGGSVVIGDVVADFVDFVGITGSGAMIIFAYEAGTLDAEDGRIYRNAVVNSRTYNQTTIWTEDLENEGEFIEEDATYGQMVPGVPWYNLADAGLSTVNGDFSYQLLNIGLFSTDYRYNVGIFNASDRLTTLNVSFTPYDINGFPFLDENEIIIDLVVAVPPLAHIQYNGILVNIFGFEEPEVAKIVVRVGSWSTSNENPVPLFTSYASLVDNASSDPTTVLPSFEAPYNIECMWEPEETVEDPKNMSSGHGNNQRPHDIPIRN